MNNPFDQFIQSEPVLKFWQNFISTHPKSLVYLVGGSVRDTLLQRDRKDFDFVVTGLEQKKLESWLRDQGRVELTGKNFGVYKFLPWNFEAPEYRFIDIALPRTEDAISNSQGGYRDFETQSNPNLSIEKDLGRRDFTINAMAYEIFTKTLTDPFDGQYDLDNETIRAVGNPYNRFKEDMSRMLRAVRFAAQLNFTIEPETLAAIRQKANDLNQRRSTLSGQTGYVVPREVIGSELSKALQANPKKTITLLDETELLHQLLPQLVNKPSDYFIPVYEADPKNLTVTLALLLRELPLDQIGTALKSIGLTTLPHQSSLRIDADEVKWIVQRLQNKPKNPNQIRPTDFEKMYMNGRAKSFMETLRALGEQALLQKAKHRVASIKKIWKVKGLEKIPHLISGQDLIKLGIAEGPQIRIMLEKIRDAQLDGIVTNREEAILFVKQEQ
ncbi:CCA tRNA nucleotidyltransferase [Patescibacteria group bacterium]